MRLTRILTPQGAARPLSTGLIPRLSSAAGAPTPIRLSIMVSRCVVLIALWPLIAEGWHQHPASALFFFFPCVSLLPSRTFMGTSEGQRRACLTLPTLPTLHHGSYDRALCRWPYVAQWIHVVVRDTAARTLGRASSHPPSHPRLAHSQGEANTATQASADAYACLFPSMITSWRANFNVPAPAFFGFIQLSTWCSGDAIPIMREAQMAALTLGGVGYGVNADHGAGCK